PRPVGSKKSGRRRITFTFRGRHASDDRRTRHVPPEVSASRRRLADRRVDLRHGFEGAPKSRWKPPMKSNRARSERNGSNDQADTTGSRRSWAANVYAIVGPDGAGKTTIARAIMDRLARRGVRTWIAWMRSPRIATLGGLGITRLSKLSRTVRMGDHDDVITDLSRHPLLLPLHAYS